MPDDESRRQIPATAKGEPGNERKFTDAEIKSWERAAQAALRGRTSLTEEKQEIIRLFLVRRGCPTQIVDTIIDGTLQENQAISQERTEES